MSIYTDTELTPREHFVLEHEAEQNRLMREHAVHMKELEIALQREKNLASVELKRLEAKWTSLLRLPSLIIKLPILSLLGLGYLLYAVRGIDPGRDYWNLLK